MQCPVCNTRNRPDARFCTYCGAVLKGDTDTLQPGQMVDGGTYRITRPLGKGGMGAVYLAANTKAFNRPCVVKEVIEYYDPSDPMEKQKASRRFETEARTLASLKYPGIPDIYAYFSERGRNYLVMEYIEGPNLAQGLTHQKDGQIVRGHPKPVKDVIQYAVQICEVLIYLEQRQLPVIHNDIKPANIILDTNSGRAVLVDFGTAKTRYARQSPGRPGRQQSSVYGTVGYAAAELYDGKAGPRSDVYALAATAYHLLTDDDPRDHPFKFPKMSSLPEPLRRVLGDALQTDPQKRPSPTQLRDALRSLYPESSDGSKRSPLTFPQGMEATTRKELISLCIKHWDYASEILYDGSIAQWLRTQLHDTAAVKAAEAAVKRHADYPDAGLDMLIRSLDPKALPKPGLQLSTKRLRYEHATSKAAPQAIRFTNTGSGHLYGTVTSSAPWVKVASRVKCAPGHTQSLPVTIHTEGLALGKVHTANVEIVASGIKLASVPIKVRISAPIVDVVPAQIDLGTVSRKELFTDRAAFQVRNRGNGRADCQIQGIPAWLVLAPQTFVCPPGQSQVIELRARVDKLPAEGRKHDAALQIETEGARTQQAQVVLRTTTGKLPRRESRLRSFVMIGCATLFLAAVIVWFVMAVLPSLGW